ncbi:hypothetical protein [Pantoea ananatis]|uniref:hypothetical protein n=1 Tax=Pantoea ananas TaxID=553 RepID=UPI0020CBA0EE|nr:hypothetical protein [Pantoea ananatis]
MNHEEKRSFSPKEFLKQRHPEKFSDSVVVESGLLDRPILEHFLASLNARSQELEFEGFAKKLCEKIICPNLLEQTGPVAGGDGKTDTQTFPVSEQNALLWYQGINDSSHKERWAFAVSTRKDWKVKCRQDVEKVKKDLVDYKRVYCITNQYVKSDQRTSLEDILREETGMDVRIMDINWILDQIFSQNLQHIAIESLSIQTSYLREVNLGANDYKKTLIYKQIKKKLEYEVDPQNISHQEVRLYLDLAVLSAELEFSAIETEGLFLRSIKVARKFGFEQQLLDCYYQFAWKSHFWLEDFNSFEENLQLLFDALQSSTNASQWEALLNLVTVHKSHVRYCQEKHTIDIDMIEAVMLDKLKEIAADSSRPSNALLAKTQVLIYSLQKIEDTEEINNVFLEIKKIIKESTGLIGYPFEKMFNLINEMDIIFNEFQCYEDLLDFITEQYSLREGQIRGAEMILKRGIKRLDSNKPYEAIRILGKSLIPLYKKESSDLFVLALNVCSTAYERVGLLWSARACMLFAASVLTDKFWEKNELTIYQYKTFSYLSWLELKLGRLGYALKWLELSQLFRHQLKEPDIDNDTHQSMDAVISQIILNTELSTLKNLDKACFLLDKFGFYSSSIQLMYVLGYETQIKEEFNIDIDESFIDYTLKLRDFDFGYKITGLTDCFDKRGSYTSNISGCNINLNFPGRSPFYDFSASFLASIEGVFATCMIDKVYPKEASLEIEIIATDDSFSIGHEFDTINGNITVRIICSGFNNDFISLEYQDAYQQWIKDFLVKLLPEIFYFSDLKNVEKSIFADGAMERSSTLAASMFASRNILGDSVDNEIKNYYRDKTCTESFPLIRNKAWDADYPKILSEVALTSLLKDNDAPPEEFNAKEILKHSDYLIQDLIKPRLWDLAKWKSVLFLREINGTPGFCLDFTNAKYGAEIFKDLIEKLGRCDVQGRLKLSIILGVSSKNPSHYTVMVSEDRMSTKHKIMTMISRIHTMTPENTENIDRFAKSCAQAGQCYFGCSTMLDDIKVAAPQHFGILIKNIRFVWAWQIERNDAEVPVLNLKELPYIPPGVSNPPVLSTLKALESMKR